MKNLQEWLIAIGLFLVIPTCIYLGCNLISPTIDKKSYREEKEVFFKGYSYKDKEKYDEREKKWQQTEFFLEHEKKVCMENFINLIVYGLLACVSFFIGSIFVLPIIGASFLLIGLSLIGMYNFFNVGCALFHGINLKWIELFFLCISLLTVLWYAYQYSEKKSGNTNKNK